LGGINGSPKQRARAVFAPKKYSTLAETALGCAEIHVKLRRKAGFSRTSAQRPMGREHRKRRKAGFAGQHDVNINTP
jgi:hypothetical protein